MIYVVAFLGGGIVVVLAARARKIVAGFARFRSSASARALPIPQPVHGRTGKLAGLTCALRG